MIPRLLLCAVAAGAAPGADSPGLVPRPAHLTAGAGALPLTATTALHAAGDGAAVAAWLHDELARTATAVATPDAGDGADGITLRMDPALPATGPDWAQTEAYHLVIDAGHATLTARSAEGLFRGATTLVQLAEQGGGGWCLPALTIDDQPRFRWRGLMLDCGRHFFTVAEVERFIDLLALHKFNRFHWHLTEDQGWRIEVKSAPRLTSVGAWRASSPQMGDAGKADGQPYGGYYTQDDIRHVVAHAAARFVTVVPELEMPGHGCAAIAAYPELGNRDVPGWQDPQVGTHWGVFHHTFAPREETFAFIAKVFDEVLPLFPGAYVHIGGDEAPKDEWQRSAFAQGVIAEHDLKDAHGLQAWFVKRVEVLLSARGKRLVGWDEIQEGGLSPTATMMVWRDWKWAKLALASGNSVVMAPTSHTYFDYVQSGTPHQPAFQCISGWKEHGLDTQRVLSFEPVPDGTPAGQAAQVLGAQGQVWTEYIWSAGKVEYMTWPRACALAEVCWAPPEGRDWAEFQARLGRHLELLDREQVNYRKDDGAPARSVEAIAATPHAPLP
jgi:hexosaminidase